MYKYWFLYWNFSVFKNSDSFFNYFKTVTDNLLPLMPVIYSVLDGKYNYSLFPLVLIILVPLLDL